MAAARPKAAGPSRAPGSSRGRSTKAEGSIQRPSTAGGAGMTSSMTAASKSHSQPMTASTSARSAGSRPLTANDLQQFQYDLHVRQQPKHAKLCANGDKQPKGPIDPSPVVRLRVSNRRPSLGKDPFAAPHTAGSNGSTGKGKEKAVDDIDLTSASFIQSPYLFCFASLCKADSEDELNIQPDGKGRCLVGNTVSSLYHLKDPQDGTAEGFFVFPDIGVTLEGSFRLKLSLYEIIDAQVLHCNTVYTDPFSVYTAKKYPGAGDTTELSKSFASQGLKMRIKGGTVRSTGKSDALPLRPATAEMLPKRNPLEASTSSLKRPNTAAELLSSSRIRRRLDMAGPGLPTHLEEGENRTQSYPVPSASSPLLARDMHSDYPSRPSSGIWDERYRSGRPFADLRPSTATSVTFADDRPSSASYSSYQARYSADRPLSQPYHPGSGRHPPHPLPGSPAARDLSPRSQSIFSHLPPQYSDDPDNFRPPSSGLPYKSAGPVQSSNGIGGAKKITLPSLADMIGSASFAAPPLYRPPSSSGYNFPSSARLPPAENLLYDNEGSAAAFKAKYSATNPQTSASTEEDMRYYDYQNRGRQYGHLPAV